ncbi:hypothetical protein BGZ98_002895 [Dissophora globulifera]|nr:hypothetical protein BGZ98_002895 [Dissophora globulifera]
MTALSTGSDASVASHLNGNATSNGYDHANGSGAEAVLAGATPPSFAKVPFSQLTLYTGNTMRTGTTGQLNTSFKKSNQELISAVQDTLLYSLNTARVKGDTITITDETSLGPLEGDRSLYEVTVKMFHLSSCPTGAGAKTTPLSFEQLDAAIADLESALGIPDIKLDHFILALPNQTFDENEMDESEVVAFTEGIKTAVLPLWQRLSVLRRTGRIGRLGVAEFSKQQLEILKEVAIQTLGDDAVGPEINQVNLQDCCVLPRDLISYAKEQRIELLTHGDSTNILPKDTFATLLQPYLPVAAESLAPSFVLKYSVFITNRGLVTKKGYIVKALSA